MKPGISSPQQQGFSVDVDTHSITSVNAAMRSLPPVVQKRILRGGVLKAGRYFAKQVKASIRTQRLIESRLLMKSIGARAWTSRDGNAVGVTVGPRKRKGGYIYLRRSKAKKKWGKVIGVGVLKKKEIEAAERIGLTLDRKRAYRDPVKYAHLVEFGHGGKHPAPPWPFMRPAFSSSQTIMFGTIRAHIQKRLPIEVTKLARKHRAKVLRQAAGA